MTKILFQKLSDIGVEITGSCGDSLLLTYEISDKITFFLWIRRGSDGEDDTFKKDFLFHYEHPMPSDECLIYEPENQSFAECGKTVDKDTEVDVWSLMTDIRKLISQQS